jgi:hypothetical protein
MHADRPRPFRVPILADGQQTRRPAAPLLIVLVFGTLMITAVFSILLLTSITLGKQINRDDNANLFLLFADLAPGQSTEILKRYVEWSTYDYSYTGLETTYILPPHSEHFDRAVVTGYQGRIVQVVIKVKNLRIIDLVQHLGAPDAVNRVGSIYGVVWDTGVMTISVQTRRRYSALLPVKSITLLTQDTINVTEIKVGD